MDLGLIIQLISGIVGGHGAGAALEEKSLGMLGNRWPAWLATASF